MNSKDEAIILRTVKYGEADIIATLFTKNSGRISGLAKGGARSKKRFGTALENGNLVEISFEAKPGRDLVFLQEASLVGFQRTWRTFLEGITATSFVLELVLKTLPEHQPSLAKFQLLTDFLTYLEKENAKQLLFDFQLHWLSLSGWEPNFETCGICGLKVSDTFSPESVRHFQGVLDHYWTHVVSQPFLTRPLLEETLLV